MTGNRLASAIVFAVLLVTGVTFAAAPTVADAGGLDAPLSDVLGGEDASTLETATAGLSAGWNGLFGAKDRAWHSSSEWLEDNLGLLADDDPTAESRARAVQTYWNTHNASFERYGNQRGNWSQSQTVKIMWNINGKTATRYLLANASNGNVTSTRIVSSTTRTADHDLALCGYAAEQSYAELQSFHEEFVEPNKSVTAAYLGKLNGRYSGDVETSLIDSSGSCSAEGGAS